MLNAGPLRFRHFAHSGNFRRHVIRLQIKGFPTVTKTYVCFLEVGNQVYISCLLQLCVYLAPFSCYLRLSFPVRFTICCPKMAHFGRPIPQKRTDFNFAQGQTAMSLRSIRRIMLIRALLPFGDIPHSMHFWGHVTPFHSNRCYGNHGTVCFRKRDTEFILVVC